MASSLEARLSRITSRSADFLASRQIPAESRILERGDVRGNRAGDLVVVPGTLDEQTASSDRAAAGRRSLVRRVEGLTSVSRQLSRAVWSGRFDMSSRAELRTGVWRFLPPGVRREHGALGPQGGLVYRLDGPAAPGWRASCWDEGGFLDENPNTEMTPWPAQAMGMYYADAYGAAVFARRAAAEGEPWRSRALAALEHSRRTYHRYVRAPIWYHHEFKNGPMMEAWRDLGHPGGADWMDRLHSDNYDPNNVMAVRLHWVALRSQFRPQRGDSARIAHARARLLAHQEPSGLFLDDRPPSHRGVRDVSYHMFTLGYLARYLDVCDDEPVAEAFNRGVALARALQLSDGIVALTGRGTNNVYHQAAAVLAFTRAAATREEYVECASTSLDPIESWQRDDGFLPTALNNRAADRMAWNHCATPYNALSCYLLAFAADQLQDRRAIPRSPASPVRLTDAFARVDDQVQIVFAAGYPGSTWSGRHGSGVAGSAGVVHSGRQLFLALDDLSDLDTQVTDLPRVVSRGEELDWRRPGRVEQRSPKTIAYRVELPAGDVTVLLTVHGNLVQVELSLPDEREALAWARIPLLEEWSVQLPPGAGSSVRETPVASNPRGPGRLLTWPLNLEGAQAAYAYRVDPSLVTIVDPEER